MTIPDINPRLISDFPEFYTNPHILSLANKPRWTVSDIKKRPIDMQNLLSPNPEYPVIRGARFIDSTCLVTLDRLTNSKHYFSNNAFYLNASIDNYAVLDIEPTCPIEIRDELLKLPYFYGETSMSGKGYHLLMPMPTNFYEFPIATTKTKLQDENKYFEIIFDHWITFTRNAIQPTVNTINTSSTTWEQVYASLAINAKETIVKLIDVDEDKPFIPHEAQITDILERMYSSRPPKELANYGNDHSRYEFSILGSLSHHLKSILIATPFNEHNYTDSEKAWLLYLTIQTIIPPREKHSEYRNGMPILLHSASNVIASA